VKIGLAFTSTHIALWSDVAVLADELGYESLWLPDHLVVPFDMAGSPYPSGQAPPIAPSTPMFDCGTYLGYFAAKTARVRLGTFVYLLGLRHPLVAARAFATADTLSGGRISCGVGAGWLESEWRAAGYDPSTRGARLDEAIEVARRLWTEEVVSHDGRFWQWDPLMFEPKPPQGALPILVGGESAPALRRAARLGDGWMSMPHASLATVVPKLETLAELRDQFGRSDVPFEVTIAAEGVPPLAEIPEWEAAGVDRLIVRPWVRTRETLDGMRRFADEYGALLHP
jgi:probable F420-dependent oxidoreductase